MFFRTCVIAAAIILATGVSGVSRQVFAPTAVADQWGPIIGWRAHTGQTVAAIHATLMKDGRLLLFGADSPFGFLMVPPTAGSTATEVNMIGFRTPTEFPEPGLPYGPWSKVVDTFYCGGHATLADGSVFVAGGTRTLVQKTATGVVTHYIGTNYAAILGLTPGTWKRLPEKMQGRGQIGAAERWYPTVSRLADGRMLVTSGADYIVPPAATSTNRSIEIYTPGVQGAGAWTLLSTHEQSPQAIYNIDYSHVFTMPDKLADRYDVMIFGEHGKPVLMSLADPPESRWLVRENQRPGTLPTALVPTLVGHHGEVSVQALPPRGPNYLASSVMLPIRLNNAGGEAGYHNGSVLMVGGNPSSTYEHTVDVYDPATDKWIAQVETGVIRHHPSTVVLPDGRVLILAGHSDLPTGDPGVGRAQYIDPRNGFALAEGTAVMPEVRGYHTVSLLLPDGRVFVGGGNPDNAVFQERDNFRFYYPDYMQKVRPVINLAPTAITMGSRFGLQWKGASPVAEVALIALGSMTHSFDTMQRSVELRIVQQYPGGFMEVEAPANTQVAPAGYYMLFVIDANRVPSVARIVNLQ